MTKEVTQGQEQSGKLAQCLCVADTARREPTKAEIEGGAARLHHVCAGCNCPVHRKDIYWQGPKLTGTNEAPGGLQVKEFQRLRGYWSFKIMLGNTRVLEKFYPITIIDEVGAREAAIDYLMARSVSFSQQMGRPWRDIAPVKVPGPKELGAELYGMVYGDELLPGSSQKPQEVDTVLQTPPGVNGQTGADLGSQTGQLDLPSNKPKRAKPKKEPAGQADGQPMVRYPNLKLSIDLAGPGGNVFAVINKVWASLELEGAGELEHNMFWAAVEDTHDYREVLSYLQTWCVIQYDGMQDLIVLEGGKK